MLLDEPTVHLDVRAARAVRAFLRDVVHRRLGVTVLMSTHYLEEAEALCDRLAVLRAGRVVALGTPEEIRAQAGAAAATVVIAALPPTGDPLERRAPLPADGRLEALLHPLAAEGLRIRSVRVQRPSLEDAFLRLMAAAGGPAASEGTTPDATGRSRLRPNASHPRATECHAAAAGPPARADLLIRGRSRATEVWALQGADLEVQPGELFGVLGPNVAGKTTLLKCLCTLQHADDGLARVNGFDVRSEAAWVRRSVHLIGSGQWTAFDWGLTLAENLAFFAHLYGLPSKGLPGRVREVLDQVGLADRAKDKPNGLSAGQRQKLLLAKAYLIPAPVLVLDEPTAPLDPVAASEVRQALQRQFAASGRTLLLTTHRMAEAAALCGRVAIMHAGRVVACDTPEALCRLVPDAGVLEAALEGAVGPALAAAAALPGVRVAESGATDDTLRAVIRLQVPGGPAVDAIPELVRAMEGAGGRIARIGPAEPTLEDAFLYLTGEGLAS